jgi:hypothetical protein
MINKRWTVIMDTQPDVMPDELMTHLEKKLGESIRVIEVVAPVKPIPADFTASKMAPTRG